MLLTSGHLSEPHLPSKPVPGSHPAAELRRTMVLLHGINLSFIPIFGRNASNYKAAKKTWIEWKPYQTKRPSSGNVDYWCADKRTGGIALVNGSLNRIICADLDTPESAADFRAAFSDLPSTWLETTPGGGFHYFYGLAEGVAVPGIIKAAEYGELRGEGGYTVIAPTSWGNQRWNTLEGDVLHPYQLNQEQLDRLTEFYNRRIKYISPKRAERSNALSAPVNPVTSHHDSAIFCTEEEIKHLFTTDYESADIEIEHRLGVTDYDENGFSNSVPCPCHDDKHASGSWNRYLGAFKCQAGCTSPGFKPGWVGRFDIAARLGMVIKIADTSPLHFTTMKSILKRYLGREGDTVVKFLLAMRLNGYSDGYLFSEADAVKACAGVVGRQGVRASIQRLIDFCLFASKITDTTAQNPTPRTKPDKEKSELCLPASGYPERAVAHQPTNTSRNTSSPANKNRGRGRPATYYMMPTEAILAAGLGVEIRGRLKITLDELKTRPLTELLLEKHLRRLPNKYAYTALGKEFGKGTSTIRRHVANNPVIERKPTFSQVVEVDSVEQVRELTGGRRGVRGGRYVQNERGIKFAATPKNVEKALKRGDELTFYELGVNQFSVRQVELDDAERQRQLIRLKERAFRWLGKLAHAGLLLRERADVRADLREAANMGDTSKLERFIESAKKALRDAKGQANPADSDPLIAAAKELGAVVKPAQPEPEPPPVLYQCPNCGQTYAATFGPPPDMCDFCNDLTTWRLKTPTDL